MSRSIGTAIVVVLLTISKGALKTLFVRHDGAHWALPSGKPAYDEPIRHAAERVVEEWLGRKVDYLEQLYTFGNQVPKDERRFIEIAYYGLVPSDVLTPDRLPQRHEANWFSSKSRPKLVENHGLIADVALNRLRGKLAYTAVGFELLADEFSLAELQHIYETIIGKKLDKRNFRKKINELGILDSTGRKAVTNHGRGRPAALYRFKAEVFKQIETKGDIFAF